MVIVVTAQGNDLQGEVDPHFGRAKNFLLVHSDTMRFERAGYLGFRINLGWRGQRSEIRGGRPS
jgi:hypothetical protein